MGGGTGTGVGESELERGQRLISEIPVAELGGTILYALANDMREYDRLFELQQSYQADANDLAGLARTAIPLSLTDVEPPVSREDIESYSFESEAAQRAMAALALNEVARSLGMRIADLNSWEKLDSTHMIGIRRATVESIQPQAIRQETPREGGNLKIKYIDRISGPLSKLDLRASEGGEIVLDGRRQTSYRVWPLIDKHNGYTPTVKLTFEE